MKLTDWYPGDVKPVRPGVYERDYGSVEGVIPPFRYCYWDCDCWQVASTLVRDALRVYEDSKYQSLPWRGVAK